MIDLLIRGPKAAASASSAMAPRLPLPSVKPGERAAWPGWNNRGVRLTEDEARARLAGARVARLATAGADGQPYLVPVTFAVDDDLIYIAVDHKPKTTTKLKRLRNIRENPRVVLLADHYADDWDELWWVRVDGWASIVEDERAVAHPIDALAERYQQYRRDRPAGPVIVIQADRWTGWSST